MSERRYFNLAPVVRDLEHGRGADATAEGRDLWARFCDLVEAASETAAALDADDESEEPDDADDLTGDEVGDAMQQRGGTNGVRPRGAAPGSDAVLAQLARLESALANLQGPARSVPSGAAPVDGALQRARPVGPRPTRKGGKKRGKKPTQSK